jgi:hypothetical protein
VDNVGVGLQLSFLPGTLTGSTQFHVETGRSCLGMPTEELPGPLQRAYQRLRPMVLQVPYWPARTQA